MVALHEQTVAGDGAAIARSLREPDAFTRIFDVHYRAVYRYLARRAGRERAEDLASQTFTVAFARRASYRDEYDSARPWLLGIATNLLREDSRSERRLLEIAARLRVEQHGSHLGEVPVGGVDPELAGVLLELDRDRRDALLLHVWGELSYGEVAEALGIRVGTVRSRISRACRELREQLASNPKLEGDR